MNMKATFNERFAMKTILDYDTSTDTYDPKPVKENFLLYKYSLCWNYTKEIRTLIKLLSEYQTLTCQSTESQ